MDNASQIRPSRPAKSPHGCHHTSSIAGAREAPDHPVRSCRSTTPRRTPLACHGAVPGDDGRPSAAHTRLRSPDRMEPHWRCAGARCRARDRGRSLATARTSCSDRRGGIDCHAHQRFRLRGHRDSCLDPLSCRPAKRNSSPYSPQIGAFREQAWPKSVGGKPDGATTRTVFGRALFVIPRCGGQVQASQNLQDPKHLPLPRSAPDIWIGPVSVPCR